MKYQPTPRDLFNPPPQAREFSNSSYIEELRTAIEELYVYDSQRRVLECITEVLEDHDNRVYKGVKQ